MQGLLDKYGPKDGGGLLARYGPAPAKKPTARKTGQGPDLAERAGAGMIAGLAGAIAPRETANLAGQFFRGAAEMTGNLGEFVGETGEKVIQALPSWLTGDERTRAGKQRAVKAAGEPGRAIAEFGQAQAPPPSTFPEKLAAGAGGFAPMLIAEGVTGGAASPAIMGAIGGQHVQQAYREALQATGDENTALQAGFFAIPGAAAMVAPLGTVLGKLSRADPEAAGIIVEALKAGASGALGMGSARILGDHVHEQLTGQDREILKNALEGAAIDFPLMALLGAAAGIKPKAATAEARPEALSRGAEVKAAPEPSKSPESPEGSITLAAPPEAPGLVGMEGVTAKDVRPAPRGTVMADESGAPVPLYHGTDRAFDSLRPSEGGAAGPGVYLTHQIGKARTFAGPGGRIIEATTGANLLDVPPGELPNARAWNEKARAEGYDGLRLIGTGEVVVFDPAKINPSKPTPIEAPPSPESSPRAAGERPPEGFPWEGAVSATKKASAHEATGGVRPLTRAEEKAPLSRRDVATAFRNLALAAKQLQEPGKAFRGKDYRDENGERGVQTGINEAEWWDRRPSGNTMTNAEIHNLGNLLYVNPKAKLGPRQQEMADFLLSEVLRDYPTREDARAAKAAKKAEPETVPTNLLDPLPDEPGMRGALDVFGPRKAAAKDAAGNEGFDVPDETRADRLYSGIVNDLERIVQIEKRAPKKVRSLTGESVEEALSLFPGRKFAEGTRIEEQIVQPLTEHLKHIPLDEAGDFLQALHVPDALKELREKAKGGTATKDSVGMTEAEAAKIVSDALSGPKAEHFKKLQEWNKQANAAALDILESGSLISKETRAEWERRFGENFVHLKSVPDDMAREFFGPSGFSVTGKESKTRKGRESKAGNPIAFRLMSLREAVGRKERNRVGNLLADLVRQNEKPDLWRIEADRNKVHESEYALSFKENGEQRYIVTKDKGLADAFKRIQEPEPGAVALLDPVNKWLHNVIIKWNPVFPLYNVPKDVGSAGLKQVMRGDMKGAMSTVTGAIPAAKGVFAEIRKPGTGGVWGKRYRELRDAGGIVGWNEQYSFEDQVKAFEKAVTPQSKAALFGKLMDDVNRAAEVGTRLAAFDAFKRQGMSTPRAAMESRRITADFSRRGRWAPIYRRLYLFSGANVQGTAEIARTIKENPKRSAAVLGALIGAGYMNAAASELLGDPEELEKLSEDEKARFFGVMIGKTRVGFPAAYGFNAFSYAGHKLYDISKGEDPAKAMGEGFSAALDSFSPLPRGANPVQSLTPTAGRAAVEVGQNKKFSGAPIHPEPSPYDKNPPKPSESYFKSASGVSREIAHGLSNVGVEVYPDVLDHLAGAATGGLGQTALRTYENIRKVVTGETDGMRPQDIPIAGEALRPFVRQAPDSAGSRVFWSTVHRVETAEAKVKDGDLKPAEARAELKAAAALKAYEKPMKLLRDAIKAQKDDEKRGKLEDRLKRLQEQFLDRARSYGLKLGVE
jgi:hypothetical protein